MDRMNDGNGKSDRSCTNDSSAKNAGNEKSDRSRNSEGCGHEGAGKLQVAGDRLLDRQGRQVVLHGVNMVCKDKSRGYVGDWKPEDFRFLRSRGMNVVRLGLIWDGLEPEPGRIDETYLDRMEGMIRLAGETGIRVFLDMHQDLYGIAFGDGAPRWATLSDMSRHDASGSVWSDAYLNSEAVQQAFDRFWENAPGPDGIGLQDHYAQAWRRVAERFGAYEHVIGYDLINEPFPGTLAMEVQACMLGAFADWQASEGADPAVVAGREAWTDVSGDMPLGSSGGTDDAQLAGLAAAWADPAGRAHVLGLLSERPVYERIAASMEPQLQPFDRDSLSPFYQRVADAIREVDTESILLLEASYFSNMGVRSGIVPVLRNGRRDPQQIYSPHGYDLIVDTEQNDLWSPARVAVIFDRHEEVRATTGWPMLVGEWGAFWQGEEGRGCGTKEQGDQLRRIFETCRCGDTFWAYPDAGLNAQNIDGFRYSDAIVRGVPESVAGMLLSYRWEPETGVFSCSWKEDDSTQDTVLWIPGQLVSMLEEADGSNTIPLHGSSEEDGRGTRVSVAPSGLKAIRTIQLQMRSIRSIRHE